MSHPDSTRTYEEDEIAWKERHDAVRIIDTVTTEEQFINIDPEIRKQLNRIEAQMTLIASTLHEHRKWIERLEARIVTHPKENL